MAKIKERTIKYLGIENPTSIEEIEVELLGLDTAIKKAELKASEIRQGLSVAKLQFIEKKANEAASKEPKVKKVKKVEPKKDK